ncbi:MAG: gamma-glutamylcyclotransferase [Dehalococcoidales bacterium]|nr:gamma-glutamylcyclotransferase [Dehalococcoidales bacterium]
MLYFAYDTHLDRRLMTVCCPTAKPRFSASLPNSQLIFTGWSREWRGAIANIKRAGREKVLGGVYEIDESDLAKLDREKGFPAINDRIKVIVFKDTGEAVEAFTYTLKQQSKAEKPSPEYLKVIQKGYIDWGLL